MMTALLTLLVAIQNQPMEVSSSEGTLRVERLASLEYPWGMCYLPDGRLLITEKPGRLRMWTDGVLSAPIKGVPKVVYHDQGGLLDVERDPNFDQNQLIYLYFVEAASRQPGARDPWDPRIGPKPKRVDNTLKGGAVARAKLVGDRLEGLRVIWRQVPKTIGRGHFGGRIVFDGSDRLYITSGDRQRFTPAQNRKSSLGKVVRIASNGSIPVDNPWQGSDLWSVGHRNPLSAAIDPETGRLWIAEMGPLGGDELNVPTAKRNYGWPVVSNGDNYDRSPIPDHNTRPEFVQPVITWSPVISPSGMIFYRGDMFPAWKGDALIGGLSSMALVRVSIDGNQAKEAERIQLGRRIRDVIEADDGSLLLLVDAKRGGMLRLSRKP
ncbi:MAG: Aldose sugar dehydrogenase YliI [Fimbriimonadaceae bacterium]|nr:Aldose sugar dehydrogenase YliI [Fimbriimonadaceae bacterium]